MYIFMSQYTLRIFLFLNNLKKLLTVPLRHPVVHDRKAGLIHLPVNFFLIETTIWEMFPFADIKIGHEKKKTA